MNRYIIETVKNIFIKSQSLVMLYLEDIYNKAEHMDIAHLGTGISSAHVHFKISSVVSNYFLVDYRRRHYTSKFGR